MQSSVLQRTDDSASGSVTSLRRRYGAIVGFKHWHYTAYGAQALDMMAAFRGDLDAGMLNEYLTREHAVDAYQVLADLAASETVSDTNVLEAQLERLHR